MPSARETQRRRTQSQGANGYAFDADAKAKERMEAPVTFGGRVFHRVLKNNAVSREMQRIALEQEVANRRETTLLRQAAELPEDEMDKWQELREAAMAAGDEATDKTYELAQLLLKDDEGVPPPGDLLRDAVDITEVNALVREAFAGGVADEPSPPTEPPSTSD